MKKTNGIKNGKIRKHPKKKVKCSAPNGSRKPCFYNVEEGSIYCSRHGYFEEFTDEELEIIKEGGGTVCNRCKHFHFREVNRCIDCYKDTAQRQKEKQDNHKRCQWYDRHLDECRNYAVDETDYCSYHDYVGEYNDDQKTNCIVCLGCLKYIYCGDFTSCEACRNRGAKNREIARIKKINCNLDECPYEALENGYCGNHQLDCIREAIEKEGKKLCRNYVRGCVSILDANDEFSQCLGCRRIYSETKDPILYNKKSTKQRNDGKRELKFNLDSDYVYRLVSFRCFYCNSMNPKGWNGIDRIDSNGDYTYENVLPCCGMCNLMKSTSPIKNFLQYCCNISTHFGTIKKVEGNDRRKSTYEEYDKITIKRNQNRVKKSKDPIKFLLTKQEYDDILTYACYYCGDTNSDQIGIDRIMSDGHYTTGNVKPCCGICNMIKYSYDLPTFLHHVNKIINTIFYKRKVTFNNLKLAEFQKYYKTVKRIQCKGLYNKNKQCERYGLDDEEYCKAHLYLKQFEDQVEDLVLCMYCKKWHLGKNEKCVNCEDKEILPSKERQLIILEYDGRSENKCNGINRNGKLCDKLKLPDMNYCKAHLYMEDYDEYQFSHMKLCRGCHRYLYYDDIDDFNSCQGCRTKTIANKLGKLNCLETVESLNEYEIDYDSDEEELTQHIDTTVDRKTEIIKSLDECEIEIYSDEYDEGDIKQCLGDEALVKHINRKINNEKNEENKNELYKLEDDYTNKTKCFGCGVIRDNSMFTDGDKRFHTCSNCRQKSKKIPRVRDKAKNVEYNRQFRQRQKENLGKEEYNRRRAEELRKYRAKNPEPKKPKKTVEEQRQYVTAKQQNYRNRQKKQLGVEQYKEKQREYMRNYRGGEARKTPTEEEKREAARLRQQKSRANKLKKSEKKPFEKKVLTEEEKREAARLRKQKSRAKQKELKQNENG